ncbi:MAG: hypothetical protein JWP09_624 [Candidatus Taylorbacteria bacterium]|nr:hypothetical protein [Candidatus Taylorbacteria bacterium]
MKKIYLIALSVFVLGLSLTVAYASPFDGSFSNNPIPGSNLGGSGPSQVNSAINTSIQVQPGISQTSANQVTVTDATARAAASGSCHIPTDIGSLFTYALCLLDSAVVPFLIGLGLILFLAGVIKFVSSGDNEEARQGGRNMMLFGIISLFVMVSIWGFVNILSKSFFGTDSEIQSLPKKSATVFKQ